MKMSRIEAAMRLVFQFNGAFNRHDIDGMMKLMSHDCVCESSEPAPDGAVYSGKEAVTRFWQQFFRQSPQAQMEIEELFGFGRRCVMRWRYEWVDTAGQPAHVRGVDIFQVRDGAICEQLSYVKR